MVFFPHARRWPVPVVLLAYLSFPPRPGTLQKPNVHLTNKSLPNLLPQDVEEPAAEDALVRIQQLKADATGEFDALDLTLENTEERIETCRAANALGEEVQQLCSRP
jgi:hypothetical protein